MLSSLVVNIYAALLELGLWLLLGVGLFAGWEAKGAIGAAVGLVLAALFGAVFFGAFLVLTDIRSRVKAIATGKLGKKSAAMQPQTWPTRQSARQKVVQRLR